MKLVKDYMERKVKTAKPNDSIFQVAKLLSKYDISGAPVVSGKKVLGVISETDLIKFMKLDISESHLEMATEPHAISVVLLELLREKLNLKDSLKKLRKIRVKDFMTKEVISVPSNESILEAATLLNKYNIDRLLVIDNSRLVGIISRLDLIKALLD